MSKPITVIFEGESSGATRAFDNVGDSSKRMASKVDDSASSHVRLGEKVGNNEQKFMGTADLLDGLGATFGVNTQGATALARGLGDLSGGFEIVSGIIPSVTKVFPMLGKAMTAISMNPLMIGILVGGAIIAGLIMLEKKFGIVSSAVKGLGNAFSAMWDVAKGAINFVLSGVEKYLNALGTGFNSTLGKLPGMPDIPRVSLPRLDVGGTVLQTGVAVVHRGEVVSPAGGNPSRSAGDTIIINVGGSVTSEGDLVDAIHAGLLKKQRSGPLGIAA